MEEKDNINTQEKEKKKKKTGIFYYLNPKNIKDDVSKFGYSYNPKKAIITYITLTTLTILLGLIFKLKFWWIFGLVMFVMALFPSLLIVSYRAMYEQSRFNDVNTYIEQFLYSYRKTRKILNTLNDVATLFPSGPMHDVVDDAINHIMYGNINEDVTSQALEMIEKAYPCSRLRNVHSFALKCEQNGGDVEASIELLLNDRRLWADRAAQAQADKQAARIRVLISIVLSLCICASVLYLTHDVPIENSIIFKISTVFVIGIDMFIYLLLSKKITTSMLEKENDNSEEIACKDYQKLKEFDEEKEKRNAYIRGAFVLPFIIGGAIFKNIIVMGIFALIGLLILNSYKINHKLRVKSVVNEIEKRFPEWLMEVSLLTQYNNVMVALDLSVETAPKIFKDDLMDFIEKAKKEPDSIKPYLEFLNMFNLPDIQSAMKMLYSISNGTGGDVNEQTKTLIERNTILVDRAEKLKIADQVAGINALIYIPTLTASFKLLADMTLLLIGYMSLM